MKNLSNGEVQFEGCCVHTGHVAGKVHGPDRSPHEPHFRSASPVANTTLSPRMKKASQTAAIPLIHAGCRVLCALQKHDMLPPSTCLVNPLPRHRAPVAKQPA